MTSWVRVCIGALVRVGLFAYFRRIERFHPERVPKTGPLLFVSNHPGSVTDAFIIGSSVHRPVHFVATVRLFKVRFVAAVLRRCGIVPINRRQDDPAAMRTVAATFEHCFAVLEAGGAIGIFPEGVSYNDEQMRPVKTGAARMALEIEARHHGGLGLRIVPVGLTYAAKGKYRADVLVNVGEPFAAAEWLPPAGEDEHAAVRKLTAAIEDRIRDLILSLPSLEHRRIVESVKRLYLDRLRESNVIVTEAMPARAEELLLTQAIADAIKHFEREDPQRLTAFVADLKRYEARLAAIGLRDRAVQTLGRGSSVRGPGVFGLVLLIAGAPIALYGWLHRLAPVWFIEWAVEKFSPKENVTAQVAHASMIAGLFGFGAVYGLAAAVMWRLMGWPWAVVYLVSLPITGVLAYHYVRFANRYAGSALGALVLLRLPITRRSLARMRARLIRDIESFRAAFRRDVMKMQEI